MKVRRVLRFRVQGYRFAALLLGLEVLQGASEVFLGQGKYTVEIFHIFPNLKFTFDDN